VKLYKEH